MAGPAAMRTALRSFVSRAMMSPVRVCAKYGASSVGVREEIVAQVVLDLVG